GGAERLADRDGYGPATVARGPADHAGPVRTAGGGAREERRVGPGLAHRPANPGPPELPRLVAGASTRRSPELSRSQRARRQPRCIELRASAIRGFPDAADVLGPDAGGPRHAAHHLVAPAQGDRGRRSSTAAAQL